MKTTAKDFAVFKSACEEWVTQIGLHDWTLFYEHQTCDGGFAWCDASFEGRTATVGLSVEWKDTKPTPERLRRSALHEMLHLLLWELRHLINSRVCTEHMIEAAEHAAIRRLERLLLGPRV